MQAKESPREGGQQSSTAYDDTTDQQRNKTLVLGALLSESEHWVWKYLKPAEVSPTWWTDPDDQAIIRTLLALEVRQRTRIKLQDAVVTQSPDKDRLDAQLQRIQEATEAWKVHSSKSDLFARKNDHRVENVAEFIQTRIKASKPELPALPRIRLTLQDLTVPPPAPAFLIEGYLPKDVFALTGTGGTGKSTLWLLHYIHLILGRPLWDMEITEPGPVLFVIAEDGVTRLKWRLFNVVNQLRLARAERQQVADNFHIVNLVGTGRRLAELDDHNNIVITLLTEQVITECQAVAPVIVTFDPMIKFGPGERMVNDGEDMLVNAAHRIHEEVQCAVGYIHHVSKDVARNGIVDHHSGRGGSALGDGARAAYQLLTIKSDLASNYPGVELYSDDIAAGKLLAYHITKLSDAPRPPEPLILRRNGWLFDLVTMPTQREVESAIEAARREHARRNVDTVITYLKARPDHKPTRRNLEELYEDVGLRRNELRAAINKGLVDRVLIEVDLPPDQQHGAKKTYITVAESLQ